MISILIKNMLSFQLIVKYRIMKQKLVLALLLLTPYIHCFSLVENQQQAVTWEHFKAAFRPNIHEEEYRKLVFERNLATIEAHNADLTQTYQMGVNHFVIYTQEEFKNLFLTPAHFMPKSMKVLAHLKKNNNPLHLQIDWVNKGMVTSVQDQGACIAAYAFAAGSAIQTAYLFKNTQVLASKQQILDCSRLQGNKGCDGGDPSKAIDYVLARKSLSKAQSYPYEAINKACTTTSPDLKITQKYTWSGCTNILGQLAKSPVIVAVNADNWVFYAGGVLSSCGTTINHYVQAVGFVSGAWKLKNYWGNAWGEAGYIKLAAGNTCGICNTPGITVA